jgi:hypothetical protein
MKSRLYALLIVTVLWMVGYLALQVSAGDKETLQVIGLEGQLLDQKGKPVQEYDYIKSGRIYRLLPGAKLELSTLDGKSTFVASGPGVLRFQTSGSVTLNGKPLSPSKQESSLKQVTAADIARPELAGLAMRGGKRIQVVARTADGESKIVSLYSGYHALVIGCSDYSKGWPRLPNPVQDAKEVAKLLREMGWNVSLVTDPDWATLRTALNSLITGPGREKDKAVLVWFSGHGHTLKEADGSKLGYIVPVDAPDPDRDEMGFMEHAISMRQVETVARRIQSKHVLMIFDSCFSGAIFQITRAKPSPFIQEKVAHPVRQFLTAGSENEKVPDKSYFKTVFIQGVGDGYADQNEDGYITGQELGAYLQEKVVNYSRKAQHPQYGKINNPKLDKGDFVLVAKALDSKTAPPVVSQGKPRSLTATAKSKPPKPSIIGEKPLSGKVIVTSTVDGADFMLAGHGFKTKTSAALIVGGVPAGEHEVVARKDGYLEWTGKVIVRPDQTANLSIDFRKKQTPAKISPDEGIRQTLKAWEDSWNTRDADRLLDLLTDDARVMTRTKVGPKVFPKKGFAKILKVKMNKMDQRGVRVKLSTPESLDIHGDRADAKVLLEMITPSKEHMGSPMMRPEPRRLDSKGRAMAYFKLVRQESGWLIEDFTYRRP